MKKAPKRKKGKILQTCIYFKYQRKIDPSCMVVNILDTGYFEILMPHGKRKYYWNEGSSINFRIKHGYPIGGFMINE